VGIGMRGHLPHKHAVMHMWWTGGHCMGIAVASGMYGVVSGSGGRAAVRVHSLCPEQMNTIPNKTSASTTVSAPDVTVIVAGVIDGACGGSVAVHTPAPFGVALAVAPVSDTLTATPGVA
jgi:hypothetical protein